MIKIWPIYHSGFLVECDEVNLLFDYFKGTIPVMDPKKPLVVFASHSHSDHFNPDILHLFDEMQDVQFVLSSDIRERYGALFSSDTEIVHWMDAGEKRTIFSGNIVMTITTLRSNDLGVAFVVDTGKDKIYHAGDLNNWWWEGDEEDQKLADAYHTELAQIKGSQFDVAFIPLDPRIMGYKLGILDFTKYASSDKIVPMHFEDDFNVIDRAMGDPVFRMLPIYDPRKPVE